MSPHTRARWRIVVTAYPCPDCDAPPGVSCRTANGSVKTEPHAARSRLASANGWRDPDEAEEEHP